MIRNVGVCVFVKTLGLSPAKTRLASGIGRELADEFYELSCSCMREFLHALPASCHAYWAVAESVSQLNGYWQDFTLIEQGSGDLADRLHTVSELALQKHDVVVLLGADSPQLDSSLIRRCLEQLNNVDCVIGPANDGGFYLLAIKKNLELAEWKKIPYSTSNTCVALAQRLEASTQSFVLLPKLTDADESSDLSSVYKELLRLSHPSPSQNLLSSWLASKLPIALD